MMIYIAPLLQDQSLITNLQRRLEIQPLLKSFRLYYRWKDKAFALLA